MAMVFIFGVIKDVIMENGNLTKWMEKEHLLGQMEEFIRVDMLMIRKKDMEYSVGMMEESLKEIGLMENSMAKVNFIILLVEKVVKEFGKMVKESNGLMKIK